MNKHDTNTALFCAFRYALGRSTYITGEIANLLIKYKDTIEHLNKEQIKREIRCAIEYDEAGMDMDVEQWECVLEAL